MRGRCLGVDLIRVSVCKWFFAPALSTVKNLAIRGGARANLEQTEFREENNGVMFRGSTRRTRKKHVEDWTRLCIDSVIPQRTDVPELWADFMYKAPPFLAYYAVNTSNATLLREAVDQSGLYRQALQANISSSVSYNGLWEHIVGPQSADLGLWSTGNGWASAGMTHEAVSNLTSWIQEIVDGAIGSPMDDDLLRNYLNDTTGDCLGYGQTSASSLIASVAYRRAILQPGTFGSEYIDWTDCIRAILDRHSFCQPARLE
ncbi:hypothetical protein BT96DRAFT_1019675 [Gymnopus androsaceus JB14]|uniref:Uncharacterized protein n=1 Tax=Gymnopus androsaceus JB14 TaxID=1447944 RepID=A0A6A4HMH8_9AGAR|nr:hypothetical protein BT96DRAFT_1019675 [Gymnopus androsaceus JB14]